MYEAGLKTGHTGFRSLCKAGHRVKAVLSLGARRFGRARLLGHGGDFGGLGQAPPGAAWPSRCAALRSV